MNKPFSLLLTLILLGFTVMLLNCGDSSHPLPPSSSLTNQFAFIQGGASSSPVQVQDYRGRALQRQERLYQPGLGIQPWSSAMDSGPDSVVVMNTDGTGETVVSAQSGWFEGIHLSADGKSATFAARATDTNGTFYQVFLAKASGTSFTVTQLTTDAENHFQPQLSADGKKIVFTKYTETGQAHVIDVSGGAETLIPTPGTMNVMSPSFTPDGKSIVFEDCAMETINIVNVDGTGGAVLNDPKGNSASLDDTPSVSPDGKRVTFLQDNNVFVMDINGQNVKQLTTDRANDDPMFVNNKIVYISVRDSTGTSEIYSMNTDGTNQKRLTNNTTSEWFQWYDENIKY